MKTIKLSIVGSRDFSDLSLVYKFLSLIRRKKPEWTITIVSGGARGVDSEAEKFADKFGLNKIIYLADWTKGRGAGILRNTDIINTGDYCISFWDRKSAGTYDSIQKAKKQDKLLCIIREDGKIELTEIGKEILEFLNEEV